MKHHLNGSARRGGIAVLFPGQGSQYPRMGADLACSHPPVAAAFEAMAAALATAGGGSLARALCDPAGSLDRGEFAQPAIGALSVGLYHLLVEAGLQPDFVAGHSFGELTALWAAGVFDEATYRHLVVERARAMTEPVEPGGMIAVKAEPEAVAALVDHLPGMRVANVNSPRQVVLAGPRARIEQVRLFFEDRGYPAVPLNVSAAFHTPMVRPAAERFGHALAAAPFLSPRLPVYSNVTAAPYPFAIPAVRALLARHMMSPVQFVQLIENLYRAGARIFVECGPRAVLTNLVGEILGERSHLVVALNSSARRSGGLQLRDAWERLRSTGLPLANPPAGFPEGDP